MKVRMTIFFLLSLQGFIMAQVLSRDSMALVAFYQALDGDNWNNNEGWLEAPVEEWFGVSVERNRVISLQMVGNGLKGKLPAEINDLTALSYLSLQLNEELVGPLPKMDSLQLLRIVSLRGSDLRGPFPKEILSLQQLESLDLFDCGIIGNLPFELADLKVLDKLVLTNNPLGTTFPTVLLNMPGIYDLNLGYCDLKGPLPPLTGMVALKYLTLSGNDFNGPFPDWLPDLQYLEVLNMSECGFYGLIPDKLFSEINSGLRLFNIGLNRLEGNVDRFMTAYMPELHYFDVGNNRFSGVIPEGVFNLNILKNLELRNNNISGLPDFRPLLEPVNAFHVSANKIGFEYLENCLGITTVRPMTSSLGPQNKLLEADTIYPGIGSSISIYSGSGGRNSSYQWYFNGDELPGEVYPSLEIRSLLPDQYGVYHCIITNDSFEFDLVRHDITLARTVGTNDPHQTFEFTVFPNPCHDQLAVRGITEPILKIELIDLNGKTIRRIEPFAGEFLISMEGIPVGTYCLKIEGRSAKSSVKIVRN